MRKYETTVIIDPDVSEERRGSLFEKIKELIINENGLMIELDTWGNQKLAYEIKKKFRGHYTCINYCGAAKLVEEIERTFKIDDSVLKYMTVLLDKNVNIDKIKEEMTAAEAKSEAETSAPSDEAAQTKTAETPAPVAEQSDEPESDKASEEPEKTSQTENNEEEK